MDALADLSRLYLLLVAPAVGSFLGLLCARLPHGRPVVVGRSRCESCRAALGLLDLVPIASWLALCGRCRRCRAAIGTAPLAIEIAALGVGLWSVAAMPPELAWPGAIFGWTLLALSVMDARTLRLPDALTLPLLAGGLALAASGGGPPPADAFAGAALGGGVLAGIAAAFERLTGRIGLGFGDAKLFAATGAWVGWQGLPSVLLLASLSGLIAAAATGRFGEGRARPLPFGPFLAAGAWLVFLYGPLRL